MRISRLQIDQFRNLQTLDLEPHPNLNVIVGVNGAGKTSVLEAIYMLGYGRSFRSARVDKVIQENTGWARVRAWMSEGHDESALLWSRNLEREHRWLDQQGQDLSSLEAARKFPVLMVQPASQVLLHGGPKERRQLLGWLMFHVEHSFLGVWQRWERVRAQRNAALKQGLTPEVVRCYDPSFVQLSEQLSEQRMQAFGAWAEIWRPIYLEMGGNPRVSARYARGWPEHQHLSDLLNERHEKDAALGHTFYGPQRSDMVFTVGSEPALQRLSRGQQKILVLSLYVSSVVFLIQKVQKTPIVLLDDLYAELDEANTDRLSRALLALQAQTWMTTLESEKNVYLSRHSSMLFRLEEGAISAIS